MAWESGFFNSVNGDRLYNADKFNQIFEGLITNGVFESVGNKLAVQPNSGMIIQIATGKGWFNNHWVKNTSVKLLTVEASDTVLNRYGAVVIKVDESTSVRDVQVYIKYSEFATTPVKPTMTRSANINEYCLAYVYIPAKATSISASNIEDTRPNATLCGWVTGLVDQLDFNTIYTQFEALFNEWFSGLVDTLDENTEAMLVNALPTTTTVSLTVAGWSGSAGNYTQEVTVTNMNTSKTVLVQASDSSKDDYSNNGVECTAQSTNKLTFKAVTKPTTAISVKVVHMGV